MPCCCSNPWSYCVWWAKKIFHNQLQCISDCNNIWSIQINLFLSLCYTKWISFISIFLEIVTKTLYHFFIYQCFNIVCIIIISGRKKYDSCPYNGFVYYMLSTIQIIIRITRVLIILQKAINKTNYLLIIVKF